MSPREHYSDDRVSLHGRFDPWSDDQTTTTYESMHLRMLRLGQPIRRASGSEPASMADFALPEILEEEYLEPHYPARSATRSSAYPVQQPQPLHSGARVRSPQAARAVYPTSPYGARPQAMPRQARAAAQPARNARTHVPAKPPLRALPPVVEYREDETENPFARRSNLGAWFLATAAAAGLFGAVLFGRVLIEASAIPSTQPTAPSTAATAPSLAAPESTSGETTSVASPEARAVPSAEAPETPSLAPSAPGPESRETTTRPSTTSKRRARDRSARHERRGVVRHDEDAVAVRKTPVRETNSRGSAAPLAEERESESTSTNSIPALLRINSRPWSQIFIDGKLIGNTPQLAIRLPAGKHSVRLVNAEFGMTKTFMLKLEAGESVTRVETLQE